jgi:hypothetical protein
MQKVKKKKKEAGGSAPERGLDFQARVSAIVMTHLLTERTVGWLDGVLDDMPYELDAETGGPGDDVRFISREGERIELQAKRGLARGERLWEALIALANGINANLIDAGLLAVCPNSSGTIREELSEDIIRLGTGRTDGLRELGSDWLSRMTDASVDPIRVCARLRIVVVNAVSGNSEAERTATERLARILDNPQQAWKELVEYGRELIRTRGKATADQIYRRLSLAKISLKLDEIETRVQLQAAVGGWLHNVHAELSIPGVNGKVSFEKCWIGLDAYALEEGAEEGHDELDKAIKWYHGSSRQNQSVEESFSSHAIGRFIKKCIVLGGPGIGKSTLLKKLALEYSGDGFLTLLVKLPQVVALCIEGHRFEDCILEVALSGSGLHASSPSLADAILLCDGLDECGSQQPVATAALNAFAVAHPRARIIVCSRTIGFRPAEIAGWRRYELQQLRDTQAEDAISGILRALPFTSETARSDAVALAKEKLQTRSISGVAARSPLMLTLIAALVAKGIDPGNGKAGLYRQLFRLIEDHPPSRLTALPPSEPERSRFLELLGWSLLAFGNEPAAQTFRRCAQWWMGETGLPALASEARVCACFEYWECLGVVERVRTLTQEAITFVHKTFAEFCAARYMLKCEVQEQRAHITRAIQTPEWREALSFASHLGLSSLILQVWAELAGADDSTAGYGLDEAMELVVQSGIPIQEDAIKDFTACCLKVVSNSVSRARYAAGEALCLVAKEHWPILRLEVFNRIEDKDAWSRLVSWACLAVSPEENVACAELVAILQGLRGLMPEESFIPGLRSGPSAKAVRDHLILGAARRLLSEAATKGPLDVLTATLLTEWHSMSVGAFLKISALFKQFNVAIPSEVTAKYTGSVGWLLPPQEVWKRENAAFLEIVDDPSMVLDDAFESDLARCWELGALVTASQYWAMAAGDVLGMSCADDIKARRRHVMHGLSRVMGLDRALLTRQVRYCLARSHDRAPAEHPTLFELPRVDVKPLAGIVTTVKEDLETLERVILEDSSFFQTNAGAVLFEMRGHPDLPVVVERILTKGVGESIRIAGMLASSLPVEVRENLLLKRLREGAITQGCEKLYGLLRPPFDPRHLDAMLRGLESPLAAVAKAAAEFAAKLPLTNALAGKLRTHFVEWKTKEKPYPKTSGVVPDSPREGLAEILVSRFSSDEEFLMALAKDDRPDIRATARDPILKVAAHSSALREHIVAETECGVLEPAILRGVVTAGLFPPAEVARVVTVLRSSLTGARYAALPILDTRYLAAEQVRSEGERLLSDSDIDIREGAKRALGKLS